MTEPYSLAVEPWLPVATKDGKRIFIPIRDIGREDLLRIDTGRADCDISLTEFLIGLLAISMGPSGVRDWVKRYNPPPSPDEIDAAIRSFAHALLLDGDGPRFFQDYEAIEGEEVPISSLLIEMPGAQAKKDNADHFVKRGRVNGLSRKGAAIALLTLQTSAPAGGAGHRTSLRGGGPATTLVIPRRKDQEPTLWQTLWTNVPEGLRIETSEAEKAIPWLATTRTSESGQATTPADSHSAQAFFGMPRRIRLIFEPSKGETCFLTGEVDTVAVKSYVTKPWGFNYPSQTWPHPLSPHYRVKDTSNEWLPLHFKSSGVGYRQWVGLALQGGDALKRPADAVFNFRSRARGAGIDLSTEAPGILAAGYAMDNMKPLDFTEAMLPLISTGDEERDVGLAGCAAEMVQAAEATSSLLLTALKVALYSDRKQGQPDNSKAPLAAARGRFWADTENAFYESLRGLARDASDDPAGKIYIAAKDAWRIVIRDAALAIFDDLAPVDAPESPDIKNIVGARSFLFFALEGRNKAGASLWKALNLAMPEKREKKNKADGKGRMPNERAFKQHS
jgi:CRISPR system Cascade subunit CasA